MNFDLLNAPATAAIYLRISQDRSGEGAGVKRQREDCEALAARLGLTVTRVYEDNDISASSGRVRPEFEQMLRDRPEVIIAWHQDRLLRLTSDLEKVIDLAIPVHFVVSTMLELSTPAGRAVGRTIAAWSTYEGEQKAERVKRSNVQRVEQGYWQFSIRPYGYDRVGGEVVVVDAEAEVIREGYRRYIAGETLYVLANDWNSRGIPAMKGSKRWSMGRVKRLLENSHYAGIVTYKGDRVEAKPQWTALIDDRTWSDYLETREGRLRKGSWSTSTKHLMSGLAKCGVCGAPLLARPDRELQVYACTSKWCVSIPARDVDAFVGDVVLARLADPKITAALRAEPDTEPVLAEIAELVKRREDITVLLADGLLDRRTARAKAQGLTERVDGLRARVAAMRRESPLTDMVLARSVPSKWAALDVLAKRRVIAELGLTLRVAKGRPGRRPKGEDGVTVPDLSRLTVEWNEDIAAAT